MEYTVLSKLEAYLTLQNIEQKKESFMKGYVDNMINGGFEIVETNKEKGYVGLYNNITDNVETYYFADSLEKEFGNLIETKNAIDAAFIELELSKQRTGFVKYLNNTIETIVKDETQMFSNYPVLKKVVMKIVYHINNKHKCSLNYPFNLELLDLKKYYPPYKVRTDFHYENKFKRLYRLFVKNRIIDSDLITEENFIKVFMGNETSEYVTFLIDTPNAIKILTAIKYIYFRFRPIDIVRSKRFYTAQKILLYATNFSSSKQRENEENLQTTNETIKEIEKIFPKT